MVDRLVQEHYAKVEASLGRLELPLPFSLTGVEMTGELALEVRRHGDEVFAQALGDYAKTQKVWVRAVEEQNQVLGSNTATQAKKDAAVKVAEDARVPRDRDFREVLRGRAAEELTRFIPALHGASVAQDGAAVESLLRRAAGVDSWVWAYFG